MDNQLAQKIVNRICAGSVRIKDIIWKGMPSVFLVSSPNATIRYQADDIYADVLEEARTFGVFSSNECVLMAMERGKWSEEKEAKIKKIPKDIEEMKILIFENFNQPSVREGIRSNLRAAENKFTELHMDKHYLDSWSAETLARNFSMQYVLSETVFHDDGNKFIDNFWNTSYSDSFLLYLMNAINKNSITEIQYRYIVRNEPWRSLWSAGKTATELFGLAAANLSYEQRQAITWSKLYDIIAESHERPSQDIVNDDDALDGWMAKQNREKDEEIKKETSKNFIKNSKIKNAMEVGIVVQPEDAKSIHEMNSVKGKRIKEERQNALQRHGSLLEQQLPDVKRDLMMQINQKARDSIKGRKR